MSLPALPRVPRERRRTATLVAVGTFGLLCVVGLVLGVRGLTAPAEGGPVAGVPAPTSPTPSTSSAPSPTSASPTSAASTAPATPKPTKPADQAAFSSPSGNVRCVISSVGATCDIGHRSWKPPPKPSGCTGRWGNTLRVSATGAAVACAGPALPTGSRLTYGKAITRGPFSCASHQEGVVCSGKTGHGFTVSKAAYRVG